MDSIDIFNIAALEVMSQSLKHFPIPIDVSHKQVAKVLEGFLAIPNEYEESFEHFAKLEQISEYTILWLINEGFIIDKGSCDTAYRVTLSNKGLNALNSTPAALSDKKPLRDKVKEGLSRVTVSSASTIMVELFKSGG